MLALLWQLAEERTGTAGFPFHRAVRSYKKAMGPLVLSLSGTCGNVECFFFFRIRQATMQCAISISRSEAIAISCIEIRMLT